MTISRQKLYEQMHVRPYLKANSPCLVGHLLYLKKDKKRPLFELAVSLANDYAIEAPNANELFFQRRFNKNNNNDNKLRYENHHEFETLTIILATDGNSPLFQSDPFTVLSAAKSQLDDDPNLLIKLVIELREESSLPTGIEHKQFIYQQFFSEELSFRPAMNGASVMSERAFVYTHFRLDDGTAKYLVINRSDSPLKATSGGRLLNHLIEFENYRILALLGVAPARKIAQQIIELEQELGRIAKASLHEVESLAERERLLKELLDLAQTIEKLRAEISHRAMVSEAYLKQVQTTLAQLQETAIPEIQMLSVFINRRLVPSVGSCLAVNGELDSLSERIDRIADLMRTDINLAMEKQNTELLNALKQRSETQIKMQKVVESISVFAISYYFIGIIGYLLAVFLSDSQKKLFLGILTIPVLIGIWILQHRKVKHIDKKESGKKG